MGKSLIEFSFFLIFNVRHPEVFNTYINIQCCAKHNESLLCLLFLLGLLVVTCETGELFVNFRLAYLGIAFLTRHYVLTL